MSVRFGMQFNQAVILFRMYRKQIRVQINHIPISSFAPSKSVWMHYKKHAVNYAYGVINWNGSVFHLIVVKFWNAKWKICSSESARDSVISKHEALRCDNDQLALGFTCDRNCEVRTICVRSQNFLYIFWKKCNKQGNYKK